MVEIHESRETEIKEWREATNVYAYFAAPFPPYYSVFPVLFWVLMRQDGEDSIAGFVSTPSGFVSALEYTPDEFCGYYRAGVDAEAIVKQILAESQARGQELYQQQYPQSSGHRARAAPLSPVQPVPLVEVLDDEPLPPPPRRARGRGRRPALTE